MNVIDLAFVQQVERDHFRTVSDTGANENAMFIWNQVRRHVGLTPLSKDDLAAFCKTHKVYHVIRKGYGCEKEK
jgi:hypothetical protein